ncbi:YfiR family protein [Fulvivirga lutimaris]|uniref:YfiR family protein n=1 Tax=Fulvivirga lutimaris TaxID=1819566 RepID=UPI0012BBACF8|nr:YfiR family protein [Fulvivirga lutimaris]MTI40782.1 YfiR family protein [Fulvivirga lutimaris]
MKRVGFLKGIVVFIMLLSSSVAFAQNYQLHTVYIYSFIRYVQWPTIEGDFVIGVVGESPIIEHLKKMASAKKAGSRDIIIKEFASSASVTPTDILFVSKGASDSFEDIKSKVNTANTLLITETEGLGMEGSAINFVERNSKLAFELNRHAVEEAGLKVSTELTRLAIII